MTDIDFARRLEMSRELLSAHAGSQGEGRVGYSGAGRTLNIAFPAGLAPTPDSGVAGDPSSPLPKADVVVLTYTSDEAKALADVLSPRHNSVGWMHYARNYGAYFAKIRSGAPARMAGSLGSYWTTVINGKKVLLFKSELHMHQDVEVVDGHPTLPIKDLFKQILAETGAGHFFAVGTAGGVYPDKPLGTVTASRAARFLCKKDFKNEPFANQAFESDWTLPTKYREVALSLMGSFSSNLVLPATESDCPCKAIQSSSAPAPTFLFDGLDGIAPFHPTLTTDYFEFGTDQNNLGALGMAVEMDDAALGLAVAELGSKVLWASVRNYSDPTINGSLPYAQQEKCASEIYLKYGYWTSVMSALGVWSLIAGL